MKSSKHGLPVDLVRFPGPIPIDCSWYGRQVVEDRGMNARRPVEWAGQGLTVAQWVGGSAAFGRPGWARAGCPMREQKGAVFHVHAGGPVGRL